MAGIFINYRRDDAPGVAGRLFDYLAGRFSREDLFMDVDAMKPGVDFAKQLDNQVSHCRVLLAVIGPHWLDAKDKTGVRRLDNEKDYVRVELASALKRDIAVIPVLVDGATCRTISSRWHFATRSNCATRGSAPTPMRSCMRWNRRCRGGAI
jgi:hypothetical protein